MIINFHTYYLKNGCKKILKGNFAESAFNEFCSDLDLQSVEHIFMGFNNNYIWIDGHWEKKK